MTSWQFLFAAWDWEPSVILGCATLVASYTMFVRPRVSGRAFCFVSGVMVLFLALVSPLDTLADKYLFSAHMLQHILLILIVPPLLILGIPSSSMEQILKGSLLANAQRALSAPVFAWCLGVGTMWLWHWPRLYNAALANEAIHISEHIMFLVTAVIFWWPVLAPIERLRLSPPWAVVYLFSACTAHSILAILITFAPLGIYPAYLQPVDHYRILPLLREGWGLTPAADQQWGGLLMWVPACVVFLVFILGSVTRWYRVPDQGELSGQIPDERPSFIGVRPQAKPEST